MTELTQTEGAYLGVALIRLAKTLGKQDVHTWKIAAAIAKKAGVHSQFRKLTQSQIPHLEILNRILSSTAPGHSYEPATDSPPPNG